MARQIFVTVHLLRCKECGAERKWLGNGWAFLSSKCAGKNQLDLHDWEKIGERKELIE